MPVWQLKHGLAPSHEKVDDQDDQQHAADAASDHWAAVVVSPAAAKQKQQDDDNQNKIHVSSGLSLPLLDGRRQRRETFGSWATAIQKRSIVSTMAANASLFPGFVMYPFA
jgi:hypothetical protein